LICRWDWWRREGGGWRRWSRDNNFKKEFSNPMERWSSLERAQDSLGRKNTQRRGVGD